jgi:hypothetical protein
MTTITPSSRLEELAAKCEQASGPSNGTKDLAGLGLLEQEIYAAILPPIGDCPKYTRSLDAAMTIAPRGRAAMVLQQGLDACLAATHHRADDFTRRLPAFVSAAALRAHAKLKGEGNE